MDFKRSDSSALAAHDLSPTRASMLIGHYALGLACKRLVPSISLGALFLACQWADLLWPTLVLAGVEHFTIRPGITAVTPLDFQYYPYSHSLLALLAWG